MADSSGESLASDVPALAYARLREPLPLAGADSEIDVSTRSFATKLRRRRWVVLLLDLYIAIAAAAVTQAWKGHLAGDSLPNVLLPVVWISLLAVFAGFGLEFDRRFNAHLNARLKACITGMALYAPFLLARDAGSGGVETLTTFPIAALASVIMLLISRSLIRVYDSRTGGRRVCVVGTGATVGSLADELFGRSRNDDDYAVAIVIVDEASPSRHIGALRGMPIFSAPALAGVPIFGAPADIYEVARKTAADVVLIGHDVPLATVRSIRHAARRLGDTQVWLATSLRGVAADRMVAEALGPVDAAVLVTAEPSSLPAQRVTKAVFDRVAAVAGLVALLPALVTITALIKFTAGGRGPVIFKQVRIGKGGEPFVMYKFRTMYVDAEARLADLKHLNETDGTLFKMRDDPRVTPVGRWLRRLSLDELPQLWNVIKGDMSLVGPRPPLQREVDRYPFDMRRLVVKPGLTGLWQISGRSDLSWEDSIRLDLRYVENWSLPMDLMILARTALAVVRNSGAY